MDLNLYFNNTYIMLFLKAVKHKYNNFKYSKKLLAHTCIYKHLCLALLYIINVTIYSLNNH